MKNSDLEKTVQDAIRAEVRFSIKKRKPSNFHELYYGTMLSMTASFGWYDKYWLRQLVVTELLDSFPNLLSKNDIQKLDAIFRKASQQQQKSNIERDKFNTHEF